MVFFRRSRHVASQQPEELHRQTPMPDETDVMTVAGLNPGDPESLLRLFMVYGVCFTIRASTDPTTLWAAVQRRLTTILSPGSDFHYLCGPQDARCIFQVVDLGDESLVAAVLTGENSSAQSLGWIVENISNPIESAAKELHTRHGIVSSGHFDDEDSDLPVRLPTARVVPIALL